MNLTDDQLVALAVQEMLQMWKEKLPGQEFDNLGQLAKRVAALNSQFQNMRRDTQFQKSTIVAEAYNPYSVNDGYEDEEEEVAMCRCFGPGGPQPTSEFELCAPDSGW